MEKMEKKRTQVPLVCHGHSRPIVDLSYSPVTDDGYFLISASKDGKPMLRNGESGDWVGTFEGHKGAVWGACLDAPALRAATASADFSARLWDALSGEQLHSFEHKHIVRTIQFSQSSHLLLTGGAEKFLRIFDLNRPEAEPMRIEGMPGAIRCAVWADDDKRILSSLSDAPGVKVWDVRSPSVVGTLFTSSPCTSVEVSRDGRVITTADGSEVAFWDASSLAEIRRFSFDWPVESASLNPDTRRFVSGGADMWVRMHSWDTGEELECHKGHHGPVHCIRFAAGGESYASGSEDGTIRIWQSKWGEEEAVVGGGGAGAGAGAGVGGNGNGKGSVADVVNKVEGFHISSQNSENTRIGNGVEK